MTEKNHIVRAIGNRGVALESAVDSDTSEQFLRENGKDELLLHQEESTDHLEDYQPNLSRFGWVWPALAVLAVLAWTGLYGWALRNEFLAIASTQPAQWVKWIIDWSVPVLLVGIVWLIAMRNSRGEARRFADTAAMLSQESVELERRLNVVNRELSVARDFLAAQSRDLESLGRVASERISGHASELQALIQNNGAQVDRIGSASETALSNMTQLRDDLPIVANSARDLSNQVGNAGRTAREQLEKLIGGFERLNDFGAASDVQVKTLTGRIASALTGFEASLSQIEGLVVDRFETLESQAGTYRDAITEAEKKALAAMNERITLLQSEANAVSVSLRDAEIKAMEQLSQSKQRFAQDVRQTVDSLNLLDQQALEAAQERVEKISAEAARLDDALAERDKRFFAEMQRRQAQFEEREKEAGELLSKRLADIDTAMSERRKLQLHDTEQLVARSSAMAQQLDNLNDVITQVSTHAADSQDALTGGLASLDAQLEEKRSTLELIKAQISELTDSGVRLLEIIQSAASQSREDLPAAIGKAASELEAVERRSDALGNAMLGATSKGNQLSDYLIKTHETIAETDSSLEALSAKLAEQSEEALSKIRGLRGGFSELQGETERFSKETQQNLRDALLKLETATHSAYDAIDKGARDKVGVLADEIGSEAAQVFERSLRVNALEAASTIEQAAERAAGIGRDTTIEMRDQLTRVNELAGNLEQRIAQAREAAEEEVGNDFARRVALITDSLNSNAIDITGALSEDVTDSAWEAYLKGDRGIFTRRAVRLIDNGEAREIGELYQHDDVFRANVSRYIHDFEKMLREMLSTRDGNALGVTVLGSDMGKLYVVLAQAIERFRN